MKTYGIRGVQLHKSYNFVFDRKYRGVRLYINVGDEIKKGDIVSMGMYPKIIFTLSLNAIPKSDVQVLNGEVVNVGQVLTSSDIGGIKVKRNLSPVNGIVSFDKEKLNIIDGNVKVSELSSISGIVSDAGDKTYAIACPASSFFYSFILGSGNALLSSRILKVLDIENSNSVVVNIGIDVTNKIVLMKRNLMPVLYRQLVRLKASGVICGGLRYSDYLSIKKSYPSLPVPIFVCNGWGIRSIPSKIYDLCILSRGGDAYVQVDISTSRIFINKLFLEKDRYVESYHDIQKGTTVVIPGFEYVGKEGVVERVIGDELHILTKSGTIIVVDYRNVQVI